MICVLFSYSLTGVIWRVGADYDVLIYYLRITRQNSQRLSENTKGSTSAHTGYYYKSNQQNRTNDLDPIATKK
jgi:hypothetical protein